MLHQANIKFVVVSIMDLLFFSFTTHKLLRDELWQKLSFFIFYFLGPIQKIFW